MTPYYEADGITLYHGDCLEIDAWLGGDVLVTDPPYGMNRTLAVAGQFSDSSSRRERRVTGDKDTEQRDRALALWGEKPSIVFGTWHKPRPREVRQLLIWDKGRQSLGEPSSSWQLSHEEIYVTGRHQPGHRQTVLHAQVERGGDRPDHPTPKPVGLMQLLLDVAAPGTVVDPFAGSGSTLLAARNQGRTAIGVEIEEAYCELIAGRLAQGVLI